MLRTIMIGSYISVQGIFEGVTPNGNMLVRVGDRLFEGRPVSG